MAKKTTSAPAPKEEKKAYQLTLECGDDVQKTEGNTALEALTAIDWSRPVFAKGKLTITKGDKKFERPLPIAKLKLGLFKRALDREILAKNCEFMLK